jgi:hypothetical protein
LLSCFIFVLLRAGYFSVSEIIAKDSKTLKIIFACEKLKLNFKKLHYDFGFFKYQPINKTPKDTIQEINKSAIPHKYTFGNLK